MNIFERVRRWWDSLAEVPMDQVEPTEQSEEIHIPVRDGGEALYKCNGCNGDCIAPEDGAKQCQHCGSSSLTFQHRV